MKAICMYIGLQAMVILCLWCYSERIFTPGKLKIQPDNGGNRTRDLWFASPEDAGSIRSTDIHSE